MNASTRRSRIEAMLVNSPNDQFLRYALALEFAKEEQSEQSLALLQALMRDQPPYVPAFLMAGQQLASLRRFELAREVLRTGIEAARSQGNSHAASEMSELLVNLGSEA